MQDVQSSLIYAFGKKKSIAEVAFFRLGSFFFSPSPSPPPPWAVNTRTPKLAALFLPATPSSGRTEITTLPFLGAEWKVREHPSPPGLPVPSRRIK